MTRLTNEVRLGQARLTFRVTDKLRKSKTLGMATKMKIFNSNL